MDPLVEQSSKTLSAGGPADGIPKDGSGIVNPAVVMSVSVLTLAQGAVQLDPWLEPFEGVLKRRFSKAQKWIDHLQKTEGGLDNFSKVCEDSEEPNWTRQYARELSSNDHV